LVVTLEMLCEKTRLLFYHHLLQFDETGHYLMTQPERVILAVVLKGLNRKAGELFYRLNMDKKDYENFNKYWTSKWRYNKPLQPFAQHFIRPDVTHYDIEIINAITDDPKIKGLCPAMQTLFDFLTEQVAQKLAR
jgi:hypothetical protein